MAYHVTIDLARSGINWKFLEINARSARFFRDRRGPTGVSAGSRRGKDGPAEVTRADRAEPGGAGLRAVVHHDFRQSERPSISSPNLARKASDVVAVRGAGRGRSREA